MDSLTPENSQNYLNAIFETAAEGILLVDANGYILRTNSAFDNLLGYDPQALKGKHFTEIVHKSPQVQRLTASAKIHHFQHSTQFPIEMELTDKTGQAVPVKLRAVLIKNEEEKVVEAIGWVEGLRKDPGENRLEQKVFETQETLQNILTNSGDAIFVADANGRISLVNEAFLQMLDYQEDEIVGRHLTELSPFEGTFTTTTDEKFTVTQDYINYQAEKAGELFEKGRVVNYELYLTHRDEKIVPVEATLSLLQDPQGQRRGSIAILRDITERKRAEREIKQTRDFLENIFKTSADGIVATDAKGKLVMVNDAVEKMTGYSRDKLIGKDPIELNPKSNKGEERGKELIKKLSAEGIVTGFELKWLRKDKKLIDVEINTALLKDQEGKIGGAVASIRDITERKLAEEKLLKAMQAAEAATQAKSMFLANMSHEIRTPMNGVIGFTDMLLESDLNPEQADFAQTIKVSGEALLVLINDILDFSKIEAGKIELEEIDFDIEVLAHDVCELIRPRIKNKKVEVLCRIGDGLPAKVIGDPYRIRQVLINLMGNAAKFTEQGEIKLFLDVKQDRGDKMMLYAKVTDTGPGISQDQLESIFDKFHQADGSITRKYGGTGLGLAICKKIAELMGGNIWADSELGKGSTFHLTLLIKKSPDKKAQRFTPVTLAGKKVLITDNNPSNLEMMTRVLESAGMQVTGLSNGQEVFQAIQKTQEKRAPFDICILDFMMPGMDGYAVAKKIRSLYGYRIPLLALASATEGSAKICEMAGFNGFLPKPVVRIKLLKMIEWLLSTGKDRVGKKKINPKIITQHSMREEAKQAMSILLAEDNPVNQKLTTKLLTKAGYHVVIASNGKEAVELFSSSPEKYDIIFMDIQMPVLNGLEATRILRKKGYTQVPIIAMTASVMKKDQENCLAVGMNDYVSKPIKREVVFEKLKQWVLERQA